MVKQIATSLVISGSLVACFGDIGSSFDGLDGSGESSGQGGTKAEDDPIDFTTSQSAGGGDGFNECAAVSETAKEIPITMFVAVDKSGSMGNSNKWQNSKNAFTTFFTSQAADNINVALRFWPDSGCDEKSCNASVCSQPLVDVGPLSDPNHESALISAFNSRNPGGNTPMSAALKGATMWAVNHQTAVESKERVVVVLLTDGAPNGCDENINNIASVAANAYAQKEILTFAVGMQGSNESAMDNIAKAGNTDKGFFIGNGNAEQDLLDALKKIQQSIVACSFAMPESDDPTMPVDPNQVNVTYKPQGMGEPQTMLQVGSESECPSNQLAWYYDNPSNPAAILLCKSTCETIQADTAAEVGVSVGCATKVL